MLTPLRTSITFLICLVPNIVFGDCPIAMDSVKFESNERLRLAYLSSINEDNWKSITKDQDIGGDFLGFGMDIGADSSYSKFTEERRRVLKEWSFSENSERSGQYVTQNFSENATKAYIECIRSKAPSPDFFAVVDRLTDTSASVKFILNPPGGQKAKIVVEKLTEGAGDKAEIQESLSLLTHRGTMLITLNRAKDKDLILNVNSVSEFKASAGVTIVAEPTYDPPTYFEKLKAHIGSGNKFLVTFDERAGENCGIPSGTGWIGNFIAGDTYTTYYVPAKHIWVTEGRLQHNPNCEIHSSIGDGNRLKFDSSNPSIAYMNLWVGIFSFNKKGELFYGDTKVGRINNPF